MDADDVQNAGDSVDVHDVGDEGGTGGGGPDGEGVRRRMKYRDEEPSRRSGRYTRMTASRRASKCTERYISRRMTESNGVYRTGLRHFRFLQHCLFVCVIRRKCRCLRTKGRSCYVASLEGQ